jgi:4-hydroxy-3-methylbut-2-enyl diphosphate reductase IspH
MKVLVAETCGFCHGVRNAIRIAEKVLSQERRVYSLGPIIHNRDVVQRLAKAGLKTIDSVDEIDSGTVIIRSHGAAPDEIARLKEKGIKIIDATCVLVKRVQHIAEGLAKENYKVVVIGDENHPEVQAVVGCAKDACTGYAGTGVVVIADKSDLHKLPKNAMLGIVCQTTQTPEYFGRMLSAIQSRQGFPQIDWDLFVKQPAETLILPRSGSARRRLTEPSRALTEGRSSFSEMKVINTLCQEAIKRQESAVQLCKQVDVMFVLGGLESANTKKLAELCKKENKQTFHLQNWNELDKNMISGNNTAGADSSLRDKTAGITAGASTPQCVIDDFVKNLEAL